MASSINLEFYFSPDQLQQAYWDHKEAKTDLYNINKIKIPIGADGVTYEVFEKQLVRNTHEISKKVLSGKYLFYPLREVEIPKANNTKRKLSIARLRDVIVQKQLYQALYTRCEDWFSQGVLDRVSVAYRKGKSAHDAIRGITKARDEGFDYVLDADIQKFFDELNHQRMLDVIGRLLGDQYPIPYKLLKRYLKTDYVPFHVYENIKLTDRLRYFATNKPIRRIRQIGVPQGGVLSGMLANLYLHEFDNWLVNDVGRNIDLRYYRYADDFVVLTKSHDDAVRIFEQIEAKLESAFKLKIHPLETKSHILYLPETSLKFVGFQVTNQDVRIHPKNISKFKENFKESISRLAKHTTRDGEAVISEIVKYYVNSIIEGPPDDCNICGLPHRRYNWISFFAPVITDMRQIHKLDIWIRKEINNYLYYNRGIRVKNRKHLEEMHNMSSIMKEYRRHKRSQFCKCKENEFSEA